jgi:hypothetical protein
MSIIGEGPSWVTDGWPTREPAFRASIAAVDRALLTDGPDRLADSVIDCVRRGDRFDAAVTIVTAELPDVEAALIHLAEAHLGLLRELGEA